MRIALTADPELPVPPLHYGGIERIVDLLARGLVARGHEVTLFAHTDSNCPVELVAWPGRSSVSKFDTLVNSLALARRVAFGGFDIIHSFSRIAYLTPLLPTAIPKLMSYQRAISPRTVGLGLRLSRGSLRFSAISRWMIEDVKSVGKWHIVPNGVPIERYDFRADLPSDAPLVFLGRVEEIKGPHLAIEMAKRTNANLIIAGNVPAEHQAWCERNVFSQVDGRQISYIGPVDDRQKNQLLGQARALLMPILWEEPFGIVMAEAMACGTPVVGMRRGAVPEVVKDGVTGFVGDTIDDLVGALSRLPELNRASCRSRVERLYSDAAVVDGYLRVYEEMLERHDSAASPGG